MGKLNAESYTDEGRRDKSEIIHHTIDSLIISEIWK